MLEPVEITRNHPPLRKFPCIEDLEPEHRILSPRERLDQYRAASEVQDVLELSDKEIVMNAARRWAITPPDKITEGTIYGLHVARYSFEADCGAYRIGRTVLWINSGPESLTWTFDRQIPQPVLEVVYLSSNINRPYYESWTKLRAVVVGFQDALRAEIGVT